MLTHAATVPASDSLLSAKQVAEALGCSTETVRRLDGAGRLPRVQVGSRLVRYGASDVERYVAARTRTGRAA